MTSVVAVGTVELGEQEGPTMSFIFRKSKKVGPLRVTASKRGLSVSTGVPGARASAGTGGRRRTSVGIPGSGMRWQKTWTKRR